MIQKKICMVGVYGTGKTSLVQQYVHSIFSAKYLTTVGVKIDKKQVRVGDDDVNLLLWDLEGRDGTRDITPSYIRGTHGIIYVADGTRRETVDQLTDIRTLVTNAVGEIPSIIALNKADLVDNWKLSPADEESAGGHGIHRIRTSAMTGEGVEEAFQWLAKRTLGLPG